MKEADGVFPTIYAYIEKVHEHEPWVGSRLGQGLLKIGFTRGSADERIKQQFPTNSPTSKWRKVFERPGVTNQGDFFDDRVVHRRLKDKGFHRRKTPDGALTEYFECTLEELEVAYNEIIMNRTLSTGRTQSFSPRNEQKEAISQTATYFRDYYKKEPDAKPPHFLWNAKMRFGKTYTTYKLAQEMGMRRVLVLTYQPSVMDEWKKNLNTHVDFEGWRFQTSGNFDLATLDDGPVVLFVSFQDVRQRIKGKIKPSIEPIYSLDWDLIVLDEYHFGAWNEGSKAVYESQTKDKALGVRLEDVEDQISDSTEVIEDEWPISGRHYLYLTGTPFKALASGEFLENQIFSWTYADEQKAKAASVGDERTQYEALPTLNLLTYRMPEAARNVILQGDFDEFDLNEFFRAEKGTAEGSFVFKYASAVQEWLNFIRGQYHELDANLRPGTEGLSTPFGSLELLRTLNHTLWFLPSVGSCFAMAELLKQPQNTFFHDFELIVAAGNGFGVGAVAAERAQALIGNGTNNKTITMTQRKLTTGVSVPPWSGVFMLRNTPNPESYFQTAFRAQSPWVLRAAEGVDDKNYEDLILKKDCYIFDFAPTRAMKFISEYSQRLDVANSSTLTEKIQEFIRFLPVLAFDGARMRPVNAVEILSISTQELGGSMLTRRWQDRRLVLINPSTMGDLMARPDLMEALEKLERFRAASGANGQLNVGNAVEKIVANESRLKPLKKSGKKLNATEKKIESESKSLRKQLQDRFVWLIGRIPVFMYLTDFREQEVLDVIRQLETELFVKVTGISLSEFEEFWALGLFNRRALNQTVVQFRLAEEYSLNYAGGNRSATQVAGFDFTLSRQEALELLQAD